LSVPVVEVPKYKLPNYVVLRTWTEIYEWLCKHLNSSIWVRQVVEYFEVAETKFVQKEYLKEGALTTFSGVPFSDADDYSYLNAKRVLKLAMEELRNRKDLVQQLGIDPKAQGRGMIKGKGGSSVWDFLRLKDSMHEKDFTKYPHFNFGIDRDKVFVFTVIPHRIKSVLRRNIVDIGEIEFNDLIEKTSKNIMKAIKKEKGASPIALVMQRRYPTQSSPAIVDARLEYDLRTAFNLDKKMKLPVKHQPQWIKATYESLSHKKSNLQVSFGAYFPYKYCKVHQSKIILTYIANIWIACKPLLDAMIKGKF